MTKTIELKVFGMTCDDCVRHVTNGLKDATGVQDVSVSLKNGMAIVKANNDINPEELPRLDVFKGQYRAQLRSVKDD
ncbi:heavy metal-associated domain-containing protein [Ferroplasma sp.]|uniref:heavy-metal-associated domain-containing protein n=1 Tax=Ferroplasma sp. TaxID=2591003 RepID=UPI002607571A|nr:heavy metal-associated domain-containing protein [Ferroplasma sp.]